MATAVIPSASRSRKMTVVQVQTHEPVEINPSTDTGFIGQIAGYIRPVLTDIQKQNVRKDLVRRYQFTILEIDRLVAIYASGYHTSPRSKDKNGPAKVCGRLTVRYRILQDADSCTQLACAKESSSLSSEEVNEQQTLATHLMRRYKFTVQQLDELLLCSQSSIVKTLVDRSNQLATD